MIYFFKTTDHIYYVISNTELIKDNILKLETILNAKNIKNINDYSLLGPHLNIDTPLCSNILEIFKSININYIKKIEKFKIISNIKNINYNKYTTQIYNKKIDCKDFEHIKNFKIPLQNLNKYFDQQETDYYYKYYHQFKKCLPTYLEIFDLMQSNSEHCRHWFFRGNFIQSNEQLKSPMSLIKLPLKMNNTNNNSLIAFTDNSSVIRGFNTVNSYIKPNFYYDKKLVYTHLVLTAETHNFPTGISPFEGSGTGVGGRMRDNMATGIGSIPIAGICGYSVGNIYKNYNNYFSEPLNILIDASNGASDYGNKVGEPIIHGFTSSYSDENYKFLKPIMFSAGLSKIYDIHLQKKSIGQNDKIILFGGPAYKIGFGGGSASSKSQDTNNLEAVQRGDPYMQNKMKKTLIKCIELFENNPIISIHDQGAGGIANVTKEICEPLGADIHLDKMKCGDNTMTPIEIYLSEFQESNAIVCSNNNIKLFEQFCKDEGVYCNILGSIKNDNKFNIYYKKKLEGSFDLNYFSNNKLQKTYYLNSFEFINYDQKFKSDNINVRNLIKKIFKSIVCCSKRFLTNKVDRSVGGLIVQQQCLGPYHMPISDYCIVALSSFDNKGIGSSIGYNDNYSVLNPKELAKFTIGKMLINIVSANFNELNDIKFNANWMWPKGLGNENEKLYCAIQSLSNISQKLGIIIDGGKDSLSMYSRLNDKIIKSPGTLVCTSYVPIPNINKIIYPFFQQTQNSIWLLKHSYQDRLGGSLLYQIHNIYNSKVPTIDNIEKFKNLFNNIHNLCNSGYITSIHNIGRGGMFIHLIEMCLASGFGANLNYNKNILNFLFNEELGWIIEINPKYDNLIYELGGIKIGIVTENDFIKFNDEIFNLAELKNLYEYTSNYLNQFQTNLKCIEQEKTFLSTLEKYEYRITFEHLIFNKNIKPKVVVISELGCNSDREMCDVFYHCNFEVININMNKLLEEPNMLSDINGIVFVGGFSFSDVIKCAKGWALRIKNNKNLLNKLNQIFNDNTKFTLGVCNGCQLLLELGLFGNTEIVCNNSNKFESRFPFFKICQENIYFKDMKNSILGCWIAHKCGKFINVNHNLVTLKYINKKNNPTIHYPENPNGSEYSTAGLFRKKGNILAIMPHPERSFMQYQLPFKTNISNNYNKIYSPWFRVFQNLYYFCI